MTRSLLAACCLASLLFAQQDPSDKPAAPTATAVLLELRPLADPAKHKSLDSGRTRLLAWLRSAGREDLVRRAPGAVHAYHWIPESDGGPQDRSVRWYPRVIRVAAHRARAGATDHRWDFSLAMASDFEKRTVALFDRKQYEAPAPDADAILVELVAVDIAAEHFTGADLGWARVFTGADGRPVVDCAVRAARAAQFADWTEARINGYVAHIVDGAVTTTPRIVARIAGGRYQVHLGSVTKERVAKVTAGLQAAIDRPLPVPDRAPAAPEDDPMMAFAQLDIVRAHGDPATRAGALAVLRTAVDHSPWLVGGLIEQLDREQDLVVLRELVVTLGMLGAHAESALPKLNALTAHSDAQVAARAAKAKQQIEKAVKAK